MKGAKKICPECGAIVTNLGRHKRRNRCDAVKASKTR